MANISLYFHILLHTNKPTNKQTNTHIKYKFLGDNSFIWLKTDHNSYKSYGKRNCVNINTYAHRNI